MARARAAAKSGGGMDAIEILKSDHREVEALFEEYEEGKDQLDEERKEELASQICQALTAHAAIEEEIFYSAVRNQYGGCGGSLDLRRGSVAL